MEALAKVGHFFMRAVSSVVEHLVYTERVGGSKPSPPISAVSLRPIRAYAPVGGQRFATANPSFGGSEI
jgi:hypothetical protein